MHGYFFSHKWHVTDVHNISWTIVRFSIRIISSWWRFNYRVFIAVLFVSIVSLFKITYKSETHIDGVYNIKVVSRCQWPRKLCVSYLCVCTRCCPCPLLSHDDDHHDYPDDHDYHTTCGCDAHSPVDALWSPHLLSGAAIGWPLGGCISRLLGARSLSWLRRRRTNQMSN